MARAFTLVEILIVILIVGIVAVAVLPPVTSAIRHRQVSEAARILQGGIVGARDRAILTGRPAGIRFLPDPACMVRTPGGGLDFHRLPNGQIDPSYPLYYNRWIPIEEAPLYREGRISLEAAPLQVSP